MVRYVRLLRRGIQTYPPIHLRNGREVQEAKEEEENERMANRAQLDDPSLSREDALKKVEEYKKEEEDRKRRSRRLP